MKRFAIAAILLLTLQAAAALPQEQTNKASIDGVVIRYDNGEPLGGAQLTLLRALKEGPSEQMASTTADAAGKFSFRNLEPGKYRLMAEAPGYLRQEYNPRPVATTVNNGALLDLTIEQAIRNASVRLIKNGTIKGRVVDDAGQPVIGMSVVALQYKYDFSGLRSLRQVGSDTTNDRGEYRIYGLMPGSYFIGSGSGPGPRGGGGFAAAGGPGGAPGTAVIGAGARGSNAPPAGVSFAFNVFPGVSDIAQADRIEIKPGAEVSADLKLMRQQMHSIRGRVTDAAGQMVANTGASGQSPVRIWLGYSLFGNTGSSSNGQSYDPASGTFKLENVIPGNYTVQAQLLDAAPTSRELGAASRSLLGGKQTGSLAEVSVVVGNSDVDNLLLKLAPVAVLPGELTVEAIESVNDADSKSFPYNQVRMVFRRLMNHSVYLDGFPITASSPSPNGKFEVAGMAAAEYAWTIQGLPPTYYVKSFRFDDVDLFEKPLEFSGSATSGFHLVLSPKGGQIQGTVRDAQRQPAPGTLVAIIPTGPAGDVTSFRKDLYRNATADKDGRFSFEGIAPGDYKVFGWEGMEPYQYFDSEFLKNYEVQGQTVHVEESATVTANVQLITVPQE